MSDITEIHERLDNIEQKLDLIIERMPKKRAVNTNASGELDLEGNELRRQRVAELERLFMTMVNDHNNVRGSRYRLPKYLIGHPLKPFIEAVTVSVLVNQAAMRKIFRTLGKDDPADSTPADRAKAALDDSNLIQVCATDTDFETDSATKLALSPAECNRIMPSWLRPAEGELKGWTCLERVQARESIADDDEIIKPLPDPCGRRDWEDEKPGKEPEKEPEKEPVRKVTFGKS